jgi:hypothetical protein
LRKAHGDVLALGYRWPMKEFCGKEVEMWGDFHKPQPGMPERIFHTGMFDLYTLLGYLILADKILPDGIPSAKISVKNSLLEVIVSSLHAL